MSLADLAAVTGKLGGLLGGVSISVDLGLVFTLLGVVILGVFGLYAVGRLVVWTVRRVADMDPWQFTKLMLGTGVLFLVVGLLLP